MIRKCLNMEFTFKNSVMPSSLKNFTDYLKGTKCYREKMEGKKSEKKEKDKHTPSTPDIGHIKQIADNLIKKSNDNKEELKKEENENIEMDEELNPIHKESHNIEEGRSIIGSSLGKKDSRTKEFPHGYDKI